MASSPRLQYIPLQQELLAKGLKIDRLMDTATETVNFIRASPLHHLVFVALLEDLQNEYGEIFYHTNERWLGHAVA
jgi:hypothetical protein